MWYRNAIKYNIVGVPISSDPFINLYVGEDEESTKEEKVRKRRTINTNVTPIPNNTKVREVSEIEKHKKICN